MHIYYILQLLAHDAVLRWDQTIYEGIRDMCNLLVELIAVGLRRKPVPIKMLELLTLVSISCMVPALYVCGNDNGVGSYLSIVLLVCLPSRSCPLL